MRKLPIIIPLLAFMLMACGKQIPKGILPPDEMENILYDYHLAKVMSDELPYDENYQKELYKNNVFEKYKITSADFDSSMVWYTTHADILTGIYQNIEKRYRNNSEKVAAMNVGGIKNGYKSLNGDTIDIWNRSSLYWLTPFDATNKVKFNIVADTTFRSNDVYVMNSDCYFIKDGKQEAVMAINIIYDNDSIVGNTRNINRSGHFELTFYVGNSERSIRSVNGFIYYKGDKSLPGMLANNISLMRYHRNIPTIESNDSIQNASASSSNNDTTRVLSTDNRNNGNQQMETINKESDTTATQPAEPLRNDPRSIRERNPRRVRSKGN